MIILRNSIGKHIPMTTADIPFLEAQIRELRNKFNDQIYFQMEDGEIRQIPRYLADDIEDGYVTILGREYEIECDCNEHNQEWIQEDSETGINQGYTVCENCNRTTWR